MGVMTKVQGMEGDEELSQVMGEFDSWRVQRRSSRERIPEQLWERATSLARHHGVSRVAKLLHLAHSGLGRRVALASGAGPAPEQFGPSVAQFVEMFMPAPTIASVPVHTSEQARPECVIEMVNALGTKMRVELSGAGLVGLSALCQVFCAGR
jgi:hypothetical protein